TRVRRARYRLVRGNSRREGDVKQAEERPAATGFPVGWASLIAAAVGAVVVHLLRQDPYSNPDSHAFEAIARSLLAGQGFVYREPMFPSLPLYAFRAPGFSAFLALGLELGGVAAVLTLQGALLGV